MSKLNLILISLLTLGGLTGAHAQGTNYCPPPPHSPEYISVGNWYPCCAAGNCTWWAWKEATDNWGLPSKIPNWGNAYQWASNAQKSGFVVSSIPAPFTVGVNVTQRDGSGVLTGHVVWVTGLSSDGTTVTVSEMSCGSTGVSSNKPYPTSYFTAGGGGFIYPNYQVGTPTVYGYGPSIVTHSTRNQIVTFYGSSLFPKVVYVTFPNGGHAILQGFGQIPFYSPSYVQLEMEMTAPGWWTIQVINTDGRASNAFRFYVD